MKAYISELRCENCLQVLEVRPEHSRRVVCCPNDTCENYMKLFLAPTVDLVPVEISNDEC